MPKYRRVRYWNVPSLPENSLTVENWLKLLSREEIDKCRHWAEPWPLLQTMTDREALDHVQRYRAGGIAGLLAGRLSGIFSAG